MRFLSVVLLVLVPLPLSAQEVARWSFEGSDLATGPGGATTTPRELASTEAFSDDVPGPFVYDPLSKESRPNRSSGSFAGGAEPSRPVIGQVDFAATGLGAGSFTLEAFVRPAHGARGDAWIAGKTRATEAGSEAALQWHFLNNSNQTWHGAQIAWPEAGAKRWSAGHYSSSTRLDDESVTWRHLALVYDAEKHAAACWVDYHLLAQMPVDKPLKFDDGPFVIGGRSDGWGIAGKIDEVRIVRGALAPAEFQRARRDAISGVSFASDQRIVPLDAGCLDVKANFGAVGDGVTDDTDAFNAAFAHLASRVPLAYSTLIIPPGTYLVSDMLYCSRFIDVKGAGPHRTTIRLKDASPGFEDPSKPRPVLRMSSTSGDPGSHSWVNGSSISIYLDGLTIDTGRNNPGAKGLEYHSNNLGRLENVVIRSGDGSGPVGLDLTHHDVGPALVKRVVVEGFDLGAAIRYQEYSMTFEELNLSKQRVAGIRNEGNILAIRRLVSDNRVPAIVSVGANSMVTLLDSKLTGGDAETAAIESEGGLYALRLETSGYGAAIAKRKLLKQDPVEWKVETVAGPNVAEYVGDSVTRGFGEGIGALRLPIEETPDFPVRPVEDWASVADFIDHKVGDDFGPAVQAAIDSGARTIYCPVGLDMQFETPVRLRGKVERLIGFGHGWRWNPKVWKDDGPREQTDRERFPPALLLFDDPDPNRIVWIDRLEVQSIEHASPGTLALRSSSPNHYRTGAGGGKLFAEDVGGADWHFDHPQRVWVRQWNPESHAAGPCIHSRGATIWALGFKTEYESQKLLAEAGASTEILGAFLYPIGEIPEDRPLFENRDSRMALVYGTSVYAANHKIHIRDVRGQETKEIGNDALRWAGSRARMDLFVSE